VLKKTPLVRQDEAAECGLACIAMVLAAHGIRVGLSSLRAEYPISLGGARISDLTRVFREIGFECEALQVPFEHLSQIPIPAILHLGASHFVVLTRLGRNGATILDPAKGRLKISSSELEDIYSGRLIIAEPRDDAVMANPDKDIRLLDILDLPHGTWVGVFATLVIASILIAVSLVMPLYLKIIIDSVVPLRDLSVLNQLTFVFLFAATCAGVLQLARDWLVASFSIALLGKTISRIFNRMLHLDVSYFERRGTGDAISRMQSTIPLQSLISESLPNVILDAISLIVITSIFFFLDGTVLGVTLVGVTITLLLQWYLSGAIRTTQEGYVRKTAQEQTHLIETLKSISTIKVFGAENTRFRAWKNKYFDAQLSKRKFIKGQALVSAVTAVLDASRNILILYVSASAVLAGEMSLGTLTVVVAYSGFLSARVAALGNELVRYRLAHTHLQRVADVFSSPAEERIKHGGRRSLNLDEGIIRFSGVSFRYSSTDPFVLENFSADIQFGKLTAVRGRSGVGKSTVVKLLIGSVQPNSGMLLVNGTKLQDLDGREWRNRLGVVMQDDRLLSGTISENISFFDPFPDTDNIIECARKARIHEEITNRPMGYRSLLSEDGTNLSGGQRQRLFLARALYRRPDILIVDEGTANLDQQSEFEIVQLIQSLEMTRVVISHRDDIESRVDNVIRL